MEKAVGPMLRPVAGGAPFKENSAESLSAAENAAESAPERQEGEQ